MRGYQLAAATAVIASYAALSYYSTSNPDAKGLAIALSIGSVLLIAAVLLWRWTRPAIELLAAVCAGACLYWQWTFLEKNYEVADLVQQCGAYGLIAFSFGRSLFSGQMPLCTQLDLKLYGSLSAAESRYLRLATLAWAFFYGALALAILFFLVSQRAWSFFTNFVAFGLIVVACLADYSIRCRVLPKRLCHTYGILLP